MAKALAFVHLRLVQQLQLYMYNTNAPYETDAGTFSIGLSWIIPRGIGLTSGREAHRLVPVQHGLHGAMVFSTVA